MSSRLLFAIPFCLALVYSSQQTRDATLFVRILDAETGQPTPARIRLTDANGKTPVTPPEGAVGVLWGRNDRSEGFEFAAGGAFYADGTFRAPLAAGRWTMKVSKGEEYLWQEETIDLGPGESVGREIRLERWIDMPGRGWYSADDHIHLQRSPRDNPAILRWAAGEDLHVANILEMGDFWATYFTQYAFGKKGRYREGSRILSPGQEEPRTPEIGHTISLGADALVRFTGDYYNYGRVFDRVHELGGVSGFAHQAETFHGYRGMVLTALAGKVDFIELVQFCTAGGPLVTEHYYHFLDLGIPLTALAGSDYPWCGRGPRYGLTDSSQIGNVRFYTYLGGALSFDRWLEALKKGRTFATSGPMLELKVNGALPGDTLDVKAGTILKVTARAFGHATQTPLERLEIVAHGEVIGKADGSPERLTVELEMPVEHGVWIAARAKAGPTQLAHTTPVYVTVDGGGFHNPKTAEKNLALAEEYLAGLEKELANPGTRLNYQASRHRKALEQQMADARQRLQSLAERFARP